MSRERQTALLLFAILLASYAWFFQGGGWNPNSRLDLTRALAERGTLRIDAYVRNTGDWAFRDGHYYVNKAPGLSFVAVPVWLATGLVLPADATLETRAWITNALVNGLPAAALGVMLFATLGALGAGSAAARAGTVLAYGLGTLAFPYATALYAHQPAAVLGFAAFAALLRSRASEDDRIGAACAGALVGVAVLFETSAAIIVIALGLWLLGARDLRRLAAHLAGGLPAALALAVYGWLAFEDPLARWTRFANPEVEVRVAGALFGWPSPERFYALLLSGSRGLFFTSPVLALAAVGWPALHRAHRGVAWVCAGVVAGFLVLIASFHAWHGGWTPGPRYLIPCLPFAALPMGFAFARLPRIALAAGALSIAIMSAITLVAVEIPVKVPVPLRDFVAVHLSEGRVSVNPQGLEDYRPHRDYLEMRPLPGPASRNLGELIFPESLWSALPLGLIWLGLGGGLARAVAANRRVNVKVR